VSNKSKQTVLTLLFKDNVMKEVLLSQKEYLQQLRYIITLQETRQKIIDMRESLKQNISK
tara:strand:- start:5352 stop:5531 length:180 start_codon:yes stop_codon:yes gene_type:complete